MLKIYLSEIYIELGSLDFLFLPVSVSVPTLTNLFGRDGPGIFSWEVDTKAPALDVHESV